MLQSKIATNTFIDLIPSYIFVLVSIKEAEKLNAASH